VIRGGGSVRFLGVWGPIEVVFVRKCHDTGIREKQKFYRFVSENNP